GGQRRERRRLGRRLADRLTGGRDGGLTGGRDGGLTGGRDGGLTGGRDGGLTGGLGRLRRLGGLRRLTGGRPAGTGHRTGTAVGPPARRWARRAHRRAGRVGGVRIGFGLPVSGSWATPENMIHVARRAEELGYHSLWTFQRLLTPADAAWGEPYRSVHDPLLPLAYVASATTRIRLAVAVVNLPFISPVVLAKQIATLDVLSGGRVDVGLGNGWADEEFIATGATKRGLGRRAEEYLTLLKRLWTGEVVSHEGEFYRVPGMRLGPTPVQRPHPPLLLGAYVPSALRRAGRLCDGRVSSSRADLSRLGEAAAEVRAGAEQAGRDPDTLRLVCRGPVKVRPTSGPHRVPLTGTLDQIREDIDAIAAQGMTDLFIDLNFDPEVGSPDADPAGSLRRADEALEAFAPDVPPDSRP